MYRTLGWCVQAPSASALIVGQQSSCRGAWLYCSSQ